MGSDLVLALLVVFCCYCCCFLLLLILFAVVLMLLFLLFFALVSLFGFVVVVCLFLFRCGFWFEILYMKIYITMEHKDFNTKKVRVHWAKCTQCIHACIAQLYETDRQTDRYIDRQTNTDREHRKLRRHRHKPND